MWKGFLGVFDGAIVVTRGIEKENEVIARGDICRYERFERGCLLVSLGWHEGGVVG